MVPRLPARRWTSPARELNFKLTLQDGRLLPSTVLAHHALVSICTVDPWNYRNKQLGMFGSNHKLRAIVAGFSCAGVWRARVCTFADHRAAVQDPGEKATDEEADPTEWEHPCIFFASFAFPTLAKRQQSPAVGYEAVIDDPVPCRLRRHKQITDIFGNALVAIADSFLLISEPGPGLVLPCVGWKYGPMVASASVTESTMNVNSI